MRSFVGFLIFIVVVFVCGTALAQSPEPGLNPFVFEKCDGTGNLPDPPWGDQQGNATTAFRNNGVCGFPSTGVMLHDTTAQNGTMCMKHNTVSGSDLRVLGRCAITGNDMNCYALRHITDTNVTSLAVRTYDQTTGGALEVLLMTAVSRTATVNETLCLIVESNQVCGSTDNATPGFNFINFSGTGNGCIADTQITAPGKWGLTRRENRNLDDIQIADLDAAAPAATGLRRLLTRSRRYR